jgi:hypothetical protein
LGRWRHRAAGGRRREQGPEGAVCRRKKSVQLRAPGHGAEV